MSNHLPLLLDLEPEQFTQLVLDLGEKEYRAKQLWEWIHSKRVESFEKMSNLSKAFRARLSETARLRGFSETGHLSSSDKLTEKWLFSDPQGRSVETVLIREKRLLRRTVCVSCMIGCPLGCVFCATGQSGYERNLSSGEMIEQVYRVEGHCQLNEVIGHDRAISHVVFMGMGEPLLNLDAVLSAARMIAHPDGLALSGRHITISTVGIPDGIRRLADENVNFRLALSLHASDQKTRASLLPVAEKYPLDDVLGALRVFSASTSRDLTLEYCLIQGVNDRPEDVRRLVRMFSDFPCKVNLIPLNKSPAFDGTPPSPNRIREFQLALENGGLPATVRVEKGQDIAAACGQLRSRRKGLDTGPSPSL